MASSSRARTQARRPALLQRGQRGIGAAADVLGKRATRRERAADVRQRQVRGSARDAAEPNLVGARVAVAVQQRLGVGMVQSARHRAGGLVLDDPARVHDHDPVRGLQHHAEVVADQDGGEAALGLQVLDRLYHRLLDDHVERGRRLVEHDHAWLQGQRERDRDPLPHPAGQLVRVAAQDPGVQANCFEQLGAAAPDPLGRDVFAWPGVRLEDVAEVVGDAAHRVQRIHAALQHQGESVAPLPAQLLPVQGGDVGAVKIDDTAGQAGRRAQHPGEGEAER